MGKKKIVSLVFLFILFSQQLYAQESTTEVQPGTLVFCQSVSEDWKAIGASTNFETNVVSWISRANAPYGANEIVVSIYANAQGESLLHRSVLPVRSSWDTSSVKDIPFPGEGVFIVAYETMNGETITSAEVTIGKKVSNEPIPEIIEAQGINLAELFNKYKSIQK